MEMILKWTVWPVNSWEIPMESWNFDAISEVKTSRMTGLGMSTDSGCNHRKTDSPPLIVAIQTLIVELVIPVLFLWDSVPSCFSGYCSTVLREMGSLQMEIINKQINKKQI